MSKVVKNNNLIQSPSKYFKSRVKKIKNDLPKDWRSIVMNHFPEYDSAVGLRLMNNVHKGNSADMRLTEIMEQISKGELV